ncbi:hypothetical protein BLNAU_5218 [Blattamonas nauphoetae]|uniref:Uncharacterized protein n=1 Tax=Blattamonas nauphoetae TaxID=2049346 RepID=A0ABQ9Y7R4_9EUKA|nr:hypothetical protein BLNAU_5218 [Blattamonas nauphoetae]
MLLESVLRKLAVPDDSNVNICDFVFDAHGHASLILQPGSFGLIYGHHEESVSPSEFNEFKTILHPPPHTSRQPRPFLLPLTEPLQSEDGTIFLMSLENVLSLSKFTEFLISRKIPAVIVWYIECILGVESRLNLGLADLPLQQDDIVVDNLFRFHINPLPSSPTSGNGYESAYSVSSEIQRVSQYFVELIDNLKKSNLLLIPTITINEIFHSIEERAVGNRKEYSVMFLTDDVFKSARDSILAESQIHLHYLTRRGPSLGSESEARTESDNGLFDSVMWTLTRAYILVHDLEDKKWVDATVRLTDPEINLSSPKFTSFTKLLEPELDKILKQFDSDSPCVVPQIALLPTDASLAPSEVPDTGVVVGWISGEFDIVITFIALFSSHLPQRPPRLFSSDNLVGVTLQTGITQASVHPSLFHHLPSLFKQVASDIFVQSQMKDVDPTERFDSSIFDEKDDGILTKSLLRCLFVCDLVGASQLSTLGSSNHQVRHAAKSLFTSLVIIPIVIPQLPHVWSRLRNAFRDGKTEEQYALIRISTRWIFETEENYSIFDWDGLFSADMSWGTLFLVSLDLLIALLFCDVENESQVAKNKQIILSFERHQHGVSRIVSIFDDFPHNQLRIETIPILIGYSLLMTFLINSDFPSSGTAILLAHPEINLKYLIPLQFNIFYLSYTSLNPHKPHQPPLDLLFERTLRTNPLIFFLIFRVAPIDVSHTLHNTSLCGFHALCRRGAHINLLESDYVKSVHNVINTKWMFLTPLIYDTFNLFLFFPPPLVVRFFLPILRWESSHKVLVRSLKMIMMTLLLVTAPFGDCVSLKELFRSVRHHSNILNSINDDNDSDDFGVTLRCECLEWLSIPTGFGSALVHSNISECLDPFNGQLRSHDSSDDPLNSHDPSRMFGFLSATTKIVSDGIASFGSVLRELSPSTKLIRFDDVGLVSLRNWILSVGWVGVCEEGGVSGQR